MIPESAIYEGTLRHRRLNPTPHDFSYPVFLSFLDVDRIPDLMAVSRFASYNRFNWTSFVERDHFGDKNLPLRKRLQKDASAHGIELPKGPIFLLTQLRYLGYVFNPISFFYCFGLTGNLEMVLAEVNNTFGETHNYWLHDGCRIPAGNSFRYKANKAFHVSPFLPMDLGYEFTFTNPEDTLTSHISVFEDGRPKFDATLTLKKQAWTSTNLTSALLRFPLTTAMVVARIHWQAAKLLWKRVPVFTHPNRRHAD